MTMLDGKQLGPGLAPYVIAEVGANHNGDMALAEKLVLAAKKAGADAVKFQSWTKNSLICRPAYEANARACGDNEETLESMVERYQLSTEQHHELAALCKKVGITFCSTPFSMAEADILEQCDVPFYKIASMDVTHLPLLRHVGAKGKPVILSTGMASLGEIEVAVNTLTEAGAGEVILLHCVALYPPDPSQVNLNNMHLLSEAYGLPVGYSDHTEGIAVAAASVALGAVVVEKHFTLDKALPGWDHAISANPEELHFLCQSGAALASAPGQRRRTISQDEKDKAKLMRRQIVTRRAMKAGEVLSEADLDYKRPFEHYGPNQVDVVIGKPLKNDIHEDHPVRHEDIA